MPPRHRIHVALLFAGFETAMPLVGVALGVPLGDAVGSAAEYIAGALLIGLGIYMLLAGDDEQETARLLSMTQRGAFGVFALGASISMDESAIGISAGLLHLPIPAMVIAIGAQAFVVTLIGVRLGNRLGERWRESAEHVAVAGATLITLGATLLVLRLTS